MAKVHKHLILHAWVNNPPYEEDENNIEEWLKQLVIDLDMEVLREADANYCNQETNRGMTADIHLTTSNITLHTWDEGSPYIELDVYSCKEYDKETVFEAVKYFEPTKISWTLLDRLDGIKIVDQGIIE